MYEVKLVSPVSLRSCLSIQGDSPMHQNIILACKDITLRSNKLLLALAFPLLEHILQEDLNSGDDIILIMPQFNGQEIKEVVRTLFSQEIGNGEECRGIDKNTKKDDQLCVDQKKGKDREALDEVPIETYNENIYSRDLDEKGDNKSYILYKEENYTERFIEIPIDKSVKSLSYEPNQAIEQTKPQSYQPVCSEDKILNEKYNIGDNEDLLNKKFELKCSCGNQFSSKIKLKKHMKRFSEDKRRERKKCSKSKVKLQINSSGYKEDVIHTQLYLRCKCGVQITSNKRLQIHTKNFHPVDGFKCKCGIKFRTKKNWKYHLKRSHIANGPEEIYFKTIFPNAKLEMPLPNICYHCNATFESNIQMIEHKNRYINGVYWVCTVVGCKRKYRKSGKSQTSFQLRSHLRKHRKEFINNVEKGEEEATSNDMLKKNLLNIKDDQSGEKNILAEWEHNTQQRVDLMIENIDDNNFENNLRKEREEILNCKCGKIYRIKSTLKKAKYNLKGHIIRRHGKSGPEMIHFKTTFPFEFKCYFCSELFEKKTHMIEHKKIYENGDYWVCPKPNCTTTYKKSSGSSCSSMLLGHLKQHRGEFDYSCDVCGKKFTNKALFNLHQQVHVEKHLKLETCQICSKTLSDISGLRAHMSRKHGEAKFQCGQCNKQFKLKVSLKNHHEVHSDVRPFKCNFCNQLFKQKGTMIKHIRMIHIDTKKYNCNFCEKGFITPGQLNKHEGLHTGYKPFSCNYCQKAFIQKCNMKLHAEKCSSRPN